MPVISDLRKKKSPFFSSKYENRDRAKIKCFELKFPQNFTSSTKSNMSAFLFRSDSKDDLIIIPKVFICGGFELSFGYVPEKLIEGKLNNYFLFFANFLTYYC